MVINRLGLSTLGASLFTTLGAERRKLAGHAVFTLELRDHRYLSNRWSLWVAAYQNGAQTWQYQLADYLATSATVRAMMSVSQSGLFISHPNQSNGLKLWMLEFDGTVRWSREPSELSFVFGGTPTSIALNDYLLVSVYDEWYKYTLADGTRVGWNRAPAPNSGGYIETGGFNHPVKPVANNQVAVLYQTYLWYGMDFSTMDDPAIGGPTLPGFDSWLRYDTRGYGSGFGDDDVVATIGNSSTSPALYWSSEQFYWSTAFIVPERSGFSSFRGNRAVPVGRSNDFYAWADRTLFARSQPTFATTVNKSAPSFTIEIEHPVVESVDMPKNKTNANRFLIDAENVGYFIINTDTATTTFENSAFAIAAINLDTWSLDWSYTVPTQVIQTQPTRDYGPPGYDVTVLSAVLAKPGWGQHAGPTWPDGEWQNW